MSEQNVIECVFACRQRNRLVLLAGRPVLGVAEAERQLCGSRGTLAALRRLSQLIANDGLVTVAIRRADGGVQFVRPQTAYQRARDAGWRFVQKRPRPCSMPRWFWYRQAGDLSGDGRPRREEAALEALEWDGIRPPEGARAAADRDPRIVRIDWYPFGPAGWRDGIGEALVFRRLPSGAWGMVSRKMVDRRRKAPVKAAWLCFSGRGGVLARSPAPAAAVA